MVFGSIEPAKGACHSSGRWPGQHLLVASEVRSILGAERNGLCLLGHDMDNSSRSNSRNSTSYLRSSLPVASPSFLP